MPAVRIREMQSHRYILIKQTAKATLCLLSGNVSLAAMEAET